MSVPTKLQAIIDDFQFSEGREKLELLLQYAEMLPPLPERFKNRPVDAVPECMTPVAIYAETQAGQLQFHFDIPPESPTVRGYAAILLQGLEGATAEQILAVPGDFFQQMGLHTVLSYQRLNGMASILAHLKQLAVRSLEGSQENS
jgi:cysteine desulfuration protein SufE